MLLGRCELVLIIWNSTDEGEREFLFSFELEFEETAQLLHSILDRSIVTPNSTYTLMILEFKNFPISFPYMI